MTFRNCVAVDLGASSGRVMLARYERECRSLTLREIHRFNNGLHSQNGYVTWDVDSLESAIRLGLNKVCEEGIRIDSIGIDTWGVDFVLLDQQGQRVGLPVAYRDSRTNGLMRRHNNNSANAIFINVAASSFCPSIRFISCVR